MKLYVISANTYEDSWGTEINIFGVYDEEHVQRALEELSLIHIFLINGLKTHILMIKAILK